MKQTFALVLALLSRAYMARAMRSLVKMVRRCISAIAF